MIIITKTNQLQYLPQLLVLLKTISLHHIFNWWFMTQAINSIMQVRIGKFLSFRIYKMTAHHSDKPNPSDLGSLQHRRKLEQVLPSSASCPLYSVSHLQPVVRMFPAHLPLFIHSGFFFSPWADLDLFSAVLLAALLLCASGAPVGDESTAGGFSGEEIEEERSSFVDLLANLRGLIHSTHQIQKAVRARSKCSSEVVYTLIKSF